LSIPCNSGDKWRCSIGNQTLDSRQRHHKSRRHLCSLKLAGCKHKRFYFRLGQSRSLGDAVADAIILGEHDPAALANLRQPIFIFGVRSKVIVVDFDSLAEFTQRLRDDFPAERAVNEKD